MIRVFIMAESNDRADALSALLEEDPQFETAELGFCDIILCAGISRQRLPARGKPIVAIGRSADDDALFDSTLKAWLPATAGLDTISAALVAACSGLTVLTRAQATRAFRTLAVPADQSAEPEHLTAREHQVLTMVSAGLGNKEIARQLGISANTAKFHVRQIMGKLDVESRTEAVAVAIRRGLVAI